MSKTRFGGTSPSALASWATTGRCLAAATSSAGSSTSPASACEPPGVGAEAPALLARDQLALGDLRRERDERERLAAEHVDVAGAAAAHRDRLGVLLLGARDRLDVGLRQRLLEPPQRVAQLPLAEDLAQAGAVGAARDLRLEVEVDGDVVDGRGELLGEPRGVGELGQVLLALGARDLVDAREHGLEVAEALQQVRRGLVADARDAGDVVARVALEADEVGDQLGRDAVAVDHALAVVDLRVGDAARGGHDPHALVDELVGVAVAGDDHHGDLALLRLHDERGDHVVGLEALDGDVPVAERLDERAQVRPLQLQQVGPARALRLVVGRDLLAARQAGVPHHDGRHLAVVGEDLHEHRREAEDRVRRAPVRGRDRLGEREERAVGERVPVDQEQLARGVSVAGCHPPDTLCRARGYVGATSPRHPLDRLVCPRWPPRPPSPSTRRLRPRRLPHRHRPKRPPPSRRPPRSRRPRRAPRTCPAAAVHRRAAGRTSRPTAEAPPPEADSRRSRPPEATAARSPSRRRRTRRPRPPRRRSRSAGGRRTRRELTPPAADAPARGRRPAEATPPAAAPPRPPPAGRSRPAAEAAARRRRRRAGRSRPPEAAAPAEAARPPKPHRRRSRRTRRSRSARPQPPRRRSRCRRRSRTPAAEAAAREPRRAGRSGRPPRMPPRRRRGCSARLPPLGRRGRDSAAAAGRSRAGQARRPSSAAAQAAPAVRRRAAPAGVLLAADRGSQGRHRSGAAVHARRRRPRPPLRGRRPPADAARARRGCSARGRDAPPPPRPRPPLPPRLPSPSPSTRRPAPPACRPGSSPPSSASVAPRPSARRCRRRAARTGRR